MGFDRVGGHDSLLIYKLTGLSLIVPMGLEVIRGFNTAVTLASLVQCFVYTASPLPLEELPAVTIVVTMTRRFENVTFP